MFIYSEADHCSDLQELREQKSTQDVSVLQLEVSPSAAVCRPGRVQLVKHCGCECQVSYVSHLGEEGGEILKGEC